MDRKFTFRALQSEPVSKSKKDISVVPPPTIPPPPHPPAQKPIVSSNKGRRRLARTVRFEGKFKHASRPSNRRRFRRPSLMQSPEQKKKGLRGQHGFVHSASGSHNPALGGCNFKILDAMIKQEEKIVANKK